MTDLKFTPGVIWTMSTQVPAPNPTPQLKTLPVATILLYKYCHKDPDKFEELTKLFDDCFEAGRRYDFNDDELITMNAACHAMGLTKLANKIAIINHHRNSK